MPSGFSRYIVSRVKETTLAYSAYAKLKGPKDTRSVSDQKKTIRKVEKEEK